jgi:hypothetical protein
MLPMLNIKCTIIFSGGVVRMLKTNVSLVIAALMISFNPVSYAAESSITAVGEEVVLKPQMRAEPLTNSIYSVKTDGILPFLVNIVVLDSEEEYKDLPYIIGFANDTTIGATGDTTYAVGIRADERLTSYSLLNPGINLVNPETEEKLGFEAYVIGDADLKEYADPQILLITRSFAMVDPGTKIMARAGLDIPSVIDAKLPTKKMKGFVLSVEYPQSGVAKDAIAVISLGKRDGLQQGDLLSLIEAEIDIVDVMTKEKIPIVPVKFGEILVYKVMPKVCLGFIMSASRPVLPKDKVISASLD